MKRLVALMLATLCTFALVGCIRIPATESKFKIEFAGDYEIVNEVKEAYFAGEEVVIQLPTITEHYYELYVNGVKQEPDEAVSSDWTYTYYTFTMPNKDVLIKIEDISVDIPFPPQQ